MANKNDWQSAAANDLLSCLGKFRTLRTVHRVVSIRRGYQDGGPIMKKLGMLGIIAGAAILTAAPLSLQWSHTNVALSLASAEAQERATATSVAGVSRRTYRRAYRSAAHRPRSPHQKPWTNIPPGPLNDGRSQVWRL